MKSEGTTRSLGKFSGISNGVHHYSAGDACEFVDRSADVAFRCGSTDDVVSAEEPSACEYSFVIETPLCCAEQKDARRSLSVGKPPPYHAYPLCNPFPRRS